ncbi:hypothetical protein MN116_003129 [Schistosoma mekongi]|uniref:Uncharacterized protein n=1 Tax=Schistosoma mekongi TaxID=38744 RepID=A0AAE1ZH84_SCHME|nr:hypothetical protein MN116_003129 [Schistosoma mekongi]
MTNPMSSNIPDPHADESRNSDGNQIDWRLKACEILEEHVKELKLNNTNLVLETHVLASCLRDLLTEVDCLKTSVVRPLDDEKIMEYLLHYQSIIAQNEFDDINSLPFIDVKHPNKKSDNLLHNRNSKNSSIDSHEIRPVQNIIKQKRENSFDPPNIHSTDNRSSHRKRFAENLDENADCNDPELIRSAFRLFAKHIGSSLKREYRTAFNAPPTQDWLAGQLLCRWDELSATEKYSWSKRVKFS